MKITASKDFTAANLANIAYYLHTYLISEEHGSFDMAYYGILVNTGSCNANYAFKDNLERVKEDLKNKDLVTQMTAINTLGGFIKKQSYKVEAGNIIDKAPAQYHRPNDIITCFTLDLHGASFALAKELCDFFIRQREEVGDQQQYVIVPGAGNHSRTGDHGKMQQIVWNSIKTHFPGVDFKIFTRSLRTTSSLIAVNPISYKIANRNAGSSVPHSTPSSAGSAVRNNSTNAQNNYRLPYARSSSNLPSGTVGGPYSYTPVSGVGRGHPYPGTAPNPYSPYVPHGTAPNPYPPYGTPGIASNLYGANAVRNNQMNAGNIPSPNHYNYTGAAHDVAVQATARLPIGSTTQETYIATYAQIYAYHYYTLATQAGETVDYQSIYEYALNHASSFYQ